MTIDIFRKSYIINAIEHLTRIEVAVAKSTRSVSPAAWGAGKGAAAEGAFRRRTCGGCPGRGRISRGLSLRWRAIPDFFLKARRIPHGGGALAVFFAGFFRTRRPDLCPWPGRFFGPGAGVQGPGDIY